MFGVREFAVQETHRFLRGLLGISEPRDDSSFLVLFFRVASLHPFL